jgi:Fe-S cluster assembly protein SufD
MPGLDLYEKQFETMTAGGPEWLIDRRRRGFEAFRDAGFPSLRNEEWRFTRTKPIQERDFKPAAAYKPNGLSDRMRELTFNDAECHRIVIVNGNYAPDLSLVCDLPEGARLSSLAHAIEHAPELVEPHLGALADMEKNPFVALNTAFMHDGVFLYLPDGADIEQPIHFAFITREDGIVTHPRVLVVTGKNTRATIVESWANEAEGYFNNAVVELSCGANSSVTRAKIQRENTSAFHLATLQTHIERDARFSTENISIGGGLVRNDVNAHLGGEGIDCRLDGLYLAGERQHVDNHTFIRHAKPNCHSFELYKGILTDRARGVFNGRIYVDQDAQKTDAKQENNCILLSDDARINTNPQLEIFADDVKCTHGATIGQLDESAIFYLRSRGIDRDQARHILIHAFAAELFDRIGVADVRERLEVELFWWLSKSVAL